MRIFRSLKGKIRLNDSLDTIKILLFWDIIKTKNYAMLDIDYKKSKQYTQKELELCELVWFRLFDEYYLLREDSTTKANLVKSFDELKLHEKITQIKNAIDFLETLKGWIGVIEEDDILKYEQQCYAMLKKIDSRIKPKLFDGINPNIENLGKVLKSFINQYNISFKESEKIVKKEVKNVYEVIANAESWLERNLDVENMTVSRWIAYEKQIAEKQKAVKKNGSR